jgi:hypothetical protein
MSEQTFVSNIVEQQIETPKSSIGIYELPCGFVTPDGTLLTEVQVREMTGREEDLLASNKLPPLKKINALLIACTERIGHITDKASIHQIVLSLPQGDRVFLLMAIRRASLGDELPLEETCPACDVKGYYIQDLSELTIKPMKDPMKRSYEVALPSGKVVKYRLGTAADEERVGKVADDEKLSMMLLCRTESINGKVPSVHDIKGMSFRDRQALRDAFEDVDGGVDTSVEMTCSSCGHSFKQDVELGNQGFFFPQRAQKALSQKYSI